MSTSPAPPVAPGAPVPAVDRGDAGSIVVKITLINAFAKLAGQVVSWTGACVFAYFAWRITEALAGQHTAADFGLHLLANNGFSQTVAYLVGLSGVGYGLGERRLRRRNIERLGPRASALEAAIDPHRTSSNLTRRGQTAPEDSI